MNLRITFATFFIFVVSISCAQDSLSHTTRWHQNKWVKGLSTPLILTGVGIYVHQDDALLNRFDIKKELRGNHPDFSTNIDDFTRYVSPATVFILDAFGMKGKHKPARQALLFVKANAFALALAFPLKGITKVRRPDDSSSASMPSLHTAQAFLGAAFLHKEYGHISPWISISGYTLAAATGYLRIMNNKHWASDVLVGAAVGILCTNLAYLTKRKKSRKSQLSLKNVLVTPVYNAGPGVAMVLKL